MVIMKEFCSSENLRLLRLRCTEIQIAEEQEEGIFWHWIRYDGILHSAGDILDISLPARGPGGWATEPDIRDV